MSESKYTPGPWAWFGNASSNSIYLATTHSGRRYIMDFVRWGFNGAQPRFQPSGRGGMIDAKNLLKFAVGDQSIVGIDAARKDGSVYRYDIRGLDCADAQLIAAAPELVEALQEARTQISLLQGMRGIVDTGHGTLSIIDAALAKAGVKVEMEDAQ